MGLIEVDFSEVTGPIEAGVYKARVTSVEYKNATTKSGDAWPHVSWEFEIYGADNTKMNGRKVRTNTNTTGKGAFRLKDVIYAVTGETLGKDTKQINLEMCAGRELAITVKYPADSQYPDVTGFKPITQ